MQESYLYTMIKNVLGQSTKIQGRFFVAEGYGNDLNAGNFDNIIKDALSNIKVEKKYPLSVMMPPVEVETESTGWSNFRCELYFITLHNQNESIAGKRINKDNNTSEQQIYEDWEEMRLAAGDFVTAFTEATRHLGILHQLRINQRTTPVYNRISKMNNDGCNGVSVTIDVQLAKDCILLDYSLGYLGEIESPGSPDYCDILKSNLTDIQIDCLKVPLRNSDDTYTNNVNPGITFTIPDNTFNVYTFGELKASLVLPSMVNHTINITM